MIIDQEGWNDQKKIQVILAHPDDPDFFCGAMLSRWSAMGHKLHYCLLTRGQRGTQDPNMDLDMLAEIRVKEQEAAAALLGISDIRWLDFMDGELIADLNLRHSIIAEIRRNRPDIVVTCDPSNIFPGQDRINHPDHRAAGQAVLDAVFPAAGNPAYIIKDETGILPAHQVEEVWLSLTHQPNFSIQLTEYLEQKMAAILCHRSQVKLTMEEMRITFNSRMEIDPITGEKAYFEKFKRIQLVKK